MGSIPEMLQSVQAGSLSMSMAVPAWYSSFMKPLDAFTLPYLVGNEEKLRPALEGPLGAQINKFAEPAGFKVLGYLLLGARSIVNKQRAVNKPEDCKGLKLRVINSPVYLATFRALGANPVAMDPSELYLALQQGVVDGFEYPAARSRRAAHVRSVEVPVARPPHDRLLHRDDERQVVERLLRAGAGLDHAGDEDGSRLAVEGAAAADRAVRWPSSRRS